MSDGACYHRESGVHSNCIGKPAGESGAGRSSDMIRFMFLKHYCVSENWL